MKFKITTTLFIFLICFTTEIFSQQTAITIDSRFSLGQNSVIPYRGLENANAVKFYGASLGFRKKNKKYRTWGLDVGYYSAKNQDIDHESEYEIFVRGNIPVFKPLYESNRLNLYFMLCPRLFYLKQNYNDQGIIVFSHESKYLGVDVPFTGNVDCKLSSALEVRFAVSLVALSAYQTKTVFDNPTPPQSMIQGSNFDMSFLTAFRIGLSYWL